MVEHNLPKQFPVGAFALDYNKFFNDLLSAQYALGELQGSQKKLENSHLLIAPLTAKEATVSSRIEGTQSTVSDVFMFEAGGGAKFSDTRQVSNYRRAMTYALDQLREGRELSLHLIETLHGILLEGVRHKGQIGKFRDEVVWIGEKDGDPIEKAIYVPPRPEQVRACMENLLKYINESPDHILVKTGLLHYQFEAIHPFVDGNGRMGRLLIPLILFQQNKLSQPILYISGYLDAHRDEYIEKLHEVDLSHSFESWLGFYFKAVTSQLADTQRLIDAIYGLYALMKEKYGVTKSPYTARFIDFIFQLPFFSVPDVKTQLKISSRNTILTLIKDFTSGGYLEETPMKFERAKIYAFKPLLLLLK